MLCTREFESHPRRISFFLILLRPTTTYIFCQDWLEWVSMMKNIRQTQLFISHWDWALRRASMHIMRFIKKKKKKLYCFCPGSNWGPCACEAHVIPLHHRSSVTYQFQRLIIWNMLKLLIYHVTLMFTQALLSKLSRWASILAIIA